MSPEYKVDILKAMLSASSTARKPFEEKAHEILAYAHSAEGKKDYQNWDVEQQFRCNILKPAQYADVFGAHLYQNNPKFNVQRTEWADEQASARATTAENYLNYIGNENYMADEMRPSIRDSLLSGLGVVWHGLSSKKGVVATVHDSWDSVYLDPNAQCSHDGNFRIRRRFKPKWWLQKRYPKKSATIAQMQGVSQPTDQPDEAKNASGTGIVFYEFYLKNGIHNYADASFGVSAVSGSHPDDARKFILAGDELLYEGPWETPFWKDGEFPCSLLHYIPRPKNPYPIAPLEAALPWIKALNWAMTIMLIQDRWASKKIIASVKEGGFGLDENEVRKALRMDGQAVSVLKVALQDIDTSSVDIKRYLQDVTFKADTNERLKTIEYLKREVEDHSGLTAFHLTGQPESQDRSAEASRNRREMAMTRLGDMRSRLDGWLGQIGRKSWITAVAHYDPQEDIAPIIGEVNAANWPMLVDPEERNEAVKIAMVTPDDQQALMRAQMMMDGITIDDVMRETQFTIEMGSTTRRSPELELSTLSEVMNQSVPIQLQSPDPYERALAFDTQAMYYKTSGLNPDLVEKYEAHAQRLRVQAEAMEQAQQQSQMAGQMPPQPQEQML